MSSSDDDNASVTSVPIVHPDYVNMHITSPERSRFLQLAKSKTQLYSETVEEFIADEDYEVGTFVDPSSVYAHYYLPYHQAQAEYEFQMPVHEKWVAHFI